MAAMSITRRRLLAGSLSGTACFAVPAFAAPFTARGLDAAHLGVRPGAPDDQSAKLQRAIDQAARARMPLWLQPGRYRAGQLKLPAGAQLIGVRGATHLTLTRGPSLLTAEHADSITLSGLTLDGAGKALPQGGGLVQLTDARALRIEDCTILRAGGNAVALQRCDGVVTASTFTDAADNALLCNDSRGLLVKANTIRRSGNGGIRIWQSVKRHDGSIVADNTIEDTAARAGGSGQNGNGVNVFRAAGVIVRNNVIRRCAFTAVRGNQSDAIQILGNNCADFDETAMYAEFDFEGAVIADNVIDGAENGIAVTNFNNGGRLGTVHGNLIRNLKPRRPRLAAAKRHRYQRRGGDRRDRQCGGERRPRRPARRLRPLSPQRHPHRQRGAQCRHGHPGLGGARRRGCHHHRQCHNRRQAGRHRRHGLGEGGDRRPRQERGGALSAIDDRQ